MSTVHCIGNERIVDNIGSSAEHNCEHSIQKEVNKHALISQLRKPTPTLAEEGLISSYWLQEDPTRR